MATAANGDLGHGNCSHGNGWLSGRADLSREEARHQKQQTREPTWNNIWSHICSVNTHMLQRLAA